MKIAPFWWRYVSHYSNEPLVWQEARATFDVIVIGGGLAGMASALSLAKGGSQVAIFDRDRLGMGAASRNGGAVNPGTNVGKKLDGSRLQLSDEEARELRRFGIDAYYSLQEFLAEHRIECDWIEAGRVMLARSSKKLEQARQVAQGVREILATEVETVSAGVLQDWFDSDFYIGGIFVSRSGSLNPGKLVDGMIKRVQACGVSIFEYCPVGKIEADETGVRVYSAAGEHRARRAIICTNGSVTHLSSPLTATYALPVASNVISLEQVGGTSASRWPVGITFSETRRVLCYFRKDPGGTTLLFGGRASFLPISPKNASERLFGFASDRIGYTKQSTIGNVWQGNVAFTTDGLPKLISDGRIISIGGCNGSGIASMISLGQKAANLARGRPVNLPSKIRQARPFYWRSLAPVGLPIIGGAFRFLDWIDDRLSKRTEA
jgi:glycine/D-amino acid oxidase-like deaminating enzyme